MSKVKAAVIRVLEGMPDDCTWSDVARRIVLWAKIEHAQAEIDAGLGIPHEQVMLEMEEWLASLGHQQPVSTSNAGSRKSRTSDPSVPL